MTGKIKLNDEKIEWLKETGIWDRTLVTEVIVSPKTFEQVPHVVEFLFQEDKSFYLLKWS